jgi:sugar lactone lactonase YvrE
MRLRLSLLTAVAGAILGVSAAHGAVTTAIFTIAGGDGHGFTGDGNLATGASLDGPAGVVAAIDGAVVVADTINQRIRRIDPFGRIRTIAGNGKRGFSGDGGAATGASLQDPTALALGKDGSLFVADSGNNRIRVIHRDGTIATLAGTADQGFSGDGGPASAAQVNGPAGLALAPDGSLYFSDTGNNRVRVIHTDGTIATVAAGLNAPAGLAVTADGSLLVADSGNNRVRRLAPDGGVTTVAGTGGGG